MHHDEAKLNMKQCHFHYSDGTARRKGQEEHSPYSCSYQGRQGEECSSRSPLSDPFRSEMGSERSCRGFPAPCTSQRKCGYCHEQKQEWYLPHHSILKCSLAFLLYRSNLPPGMNSSKSLHKYYTTRAVTISTIPSLSDLQRSGEISSWNNFDIHLAISTLRF